MARQARRRNTAVAAPGGRGDVPRPPGGSVKRLPRTETLLVFACAGAAAMLGASQFTDIFHLTPPGGEALQAISAKDQHSYATLVLAIFALVLLLVTLSVHDE